MNNSEIRYSDIEPLCLVRAVLRNIWMVFAAALCGLFGAYLVLTNFYKPQYSGSATFVVMAKSSTYSSVVDISTANTVASTFSELLSGELMQQKVAAMAGISNFSGSITAENKENTNLVTLRVTAPTAKQAFAMINALSENHAVLTGKIFNNAVITTLSAPTVTEVSTFTGSRLKTEIIAAAVCALLMGEKALCRKYLTLIDQMPLEGAFVEKYWAMLDNPALVKDDAELQHVLSLDPREERFEQNYQQPLFLGYNIGLNSGTDATLITSAAACLYSKDLQSFLARAQILAQKGASFPSAMQQALAILNVKNHGLLQQFPQVGQFVPGEISSFYMDAKPYMGKKNRLKLRHELRERWLGTYVYYYYTENNDPDQVVKPKQNQSQVN